MHFIHLINQIGFILKISIGFLSKQVNKYRIALTIIFIIIIINY
jgi:hypothetical protein